MTDMCAGSDFVLTKQGAEAKIYRTDFYGKPCIVKERFRKSYRHPSLDKSLTTQRMKSELRALLRCKTNGICTPSIYFVDMDSGCIFMEDVPDSVTIRDYIMKVQKEIPDHDTVISTLRPIAAKIGEVIGVMHRNNIVHGDLTTSNILLKGSPQDVNLVFIDFGLSHFENLAEDKGVDLYVLERALLSTHPNTEELFEIILDAYVKSNKTGSSDVISKLEEVRLRGRKRTMVG